MSTNKNVREILNNTTRDMVGGLLLTDIIVRGAPHRDWWLRHDSDMMKSWKTRDIVRIETTSDAVLRIRRKKHGDDRRFEISNKKDDRMKGKIGG